jgi:sec-independent protein translocase protein TatC
VAISAQPLAFTHFSTVTPFALPLPPSAFFFAVSRFSAENLFDHTKMTFGEHLDELRLALIKAVGVWVLGLIVALAFAGPLVEYVQTPLKHALTDFYRTQSAEEYRRHFEQLKESGAPGPADPDVAAQLLADQGLVAEDRLIDPREALAAVAHTFPQAEIQDDLPARDATAPIKPSDLVPLRIYHKLDDDPRVRVVGLSVHEPFTMYMKAAIVLGTVISSPFIFYFLWQFVAVGLYPHEKRYVQVFLPISVGLFLAGVLMTFFVVFHFVLSFLFQFYAWMHVDPDPRLSDWLSFVLSLPIVFGISFQMPLVMLFLERIGIFSVAQYLSYWRVAVLIIFILAMVLTPTTDPQTMILMAVPMTFLYFGGIAMCHLLPRRFKPFGEVTE